MNKDKYSLVTIMNSERITYNAQYHNSVFKEITFFTILRTDFNDNFNKVKTSNSVFNAIYLMQQQIAKFYEGFKS